MIMHQPKETFVRWLCASACLAFAFAGNNSHAEIEKDPARICISFAQDALAKLELGQSTLARNCECVRGKRGGRLPSAAASWNTTGPNSPGFVLVECAKNDVIDFYGRAVLITAESRMRQKGLNERQIRSFGACVGKGAHEEMKRIAASTGAPAGSLDKDGFRRMYESCEEASK